MSDFAWEYSGGDKEYPRFPLSESGGDTRSESGAPFPVGEVLDENYELFAVIGQGGFGSVYKAHDIRTNRLVAVKVLHVNEGSQAERFEREGLHAARVDRRQGVVKVHDRGVWKGRPYLVMECVEGGSLEEWFERDDASPVELARILESVARTLAVVHDAGILHRDIKPSNILIPIAGPPKIVDFGLARGEGDRSLTVTGQFLGTPAYMPPEQLSMNQEVGPRADVYSLGATLYHGLAGRPVFDGTIQEFVGFMVSETPPPLPSTFRPGVPPDLEAVCLKALEKDPDDRYQTASAFADDLARVQSGEQVHARPTASHAPLALAFIAIFTVGALLGVLGVVLWPRSGDSAADDPQGDTQTQTSSADPTAELDALRGIELPREQIAACEAWLDRFGDHEQAPAVQDLRRRLVHSPLLELPHHHVFDAVYLARRRAASSSAEGDVIVWDLGSGERLAHWERRGTRLAASADGGTLGMLGGKGLHVVEAASLETRFEREPLTGVDLAISANGRRVAVLDREGAITILDASSGAEVQSFVIAGARRIALDPAGGILVVSSRRKLEWLSVETRVVLRTEPLEDEAAVLVYSPDGACLVAAESSGGLRLMPEDGGRHSLVGNLPQSSSRWIKDVAHAGRIGGVAWIGTDTIVTAAISALRHDPQNDLAVWSASQRSERGRFLPSRKTRYGPLSISPDGRELLVLPLEDGLLQVWSTQRFTRY